MKPFTVLLTHCSGCKGGHVSTFEPLFDGEGGEQLYYTVCPVARIFVYATQSPAVGAVPYILSPGDLDVLEHRLRRWASTDALLAVRREKLTQP